MPYVFGYGSLMNPKSAARTIHRFPEGDDAIPGRVKGWKRKWQLVSQMFGLIGVPPNVTAIVFLDVIADSDTVMNGIMLRVDEEELALLDLREVNYDRLDITDSVTPAMDEKVYLYVSQKAYTNVPPGAAILEEYMKVVLSSLELWGEGFAEEYHASTIPPDLPLVPGMYARK